MKYDINDLKTKGVFDENNEKNYEIRTPCGDRYIALKEGQKYLIGDDGIKRTLRDCKSLVADDAVIFFADATEASEAPKADGTWTCVDPCALLTLIDGGCHVSRDEIDRTLDAYGWIKPDGERDTLQARENFEKRRKQ